MYYPDLSPYEYNPLVKDCSSALNVGWLDASEVFTSGFVPAKFLERLADLVENPINLTRGSHPCDFCLTELRSRSVGEVDGRLVIQELRELDALGGGEIFVRDRGGVCYFAPTLIRHYVERHDYRPPNEFVEAVLMVNDVMHE